MRQAMYITVARVLWVSVLVIHISGRLFWRNCWRSSCGMSAALGYFVFTSLKKRWNWGVFFSCLRHQPM